MIKRTIVCRKIFTHTMRVKMVEVMIQMKINQCKWTDLIKTVTRFCREKKHKRIYNKGGNYFFTLNLIATNIYRKCAKGKTD